VNEENAHDTKDNIERRLTAVKSQRSSGELEDLALIIGVVYCHWRVEDD
jgi:phospholipid-transporting ATPase